MNPIVKIIGLGYALGSAISTNDSIEKRFDLSEGFIIKKTGIKERRYFSDNEDPRDLAVQLAKQLLERLKIKEHLPVFGSANPYGEYAIPSPTMEVAHRLGFRHIPVFHTNYGCGGYLAVMQSIHEYLQLHENATVLLVLTDWPSSMVDRYETAVLFSDAVHVSVWSNKAEYQGLVVEKIFYENTLENPYALNVKSGMWNMDGGAIARFVETVPGIVAEKMQVDLNDYVVIPHQPNPKLLETLEKRYGIPFYKKDAEQFGNTTCSAMMIAFQNVLLDGNPTTPILLMGFGDTESYGGIIVKVNEEVPVAAILP
jgi:3-oxoacyl-[acyl-carrier-protein] synthase III